MPDQLNDPLISRASGTSGYGATSPVAKSEEGPPKRIIKFPFKNEGSDGARLYPNNRVVTAKYDIATFLPLNLAEQFSKVANVYFCIQSLLTFFPSISPYEWYSVIFAFLIVVSLSMAKDAYADFQRHKDDNEANNRTCKVLRDGEWINECAWQDVEVGDGIEIKRNEMVPADMLVLSTQKNAGFSEQDKDFNKAGICHLNTADMDGETNLKVYQGRAETNHLNDQPGSQSTKLRDFFVENNMIDVDEPNTALRKVDGYLHLAPRCCPVAEGSSDKPLKLDLDYKNVLLRQTRVVNTHRVWGVVIYTGAETKLAKNNAKVKERKSSSMDKMLNSMLINIFAVLMVLCFGCAIGCGVWNDAYAEDSWYIGLEDRFSDSFDTNWYGTDNSAYIGMMSFFTFFILFANLVPISLYVTVELVKFMTGYLVDWDEHMYHAEIDKTAKCRDANIAEQAGQVEYILSDKTGTLTQNKMDFLKCIIGGVKYGQVECEVEAKFHSSGPEGRRARVRADFPTIEGEDPASVFYDRRLNGGNWADVHALSPLSDDQKEKDTADSPLQRYRFLQALSLCHSVLPQQVDGKITFSSESPDDDALVKAAKLLGFALVSHEIIGDAHVLEVDEQQLDKTRKVVKYIIQSTIDFSSDRKRMTVIAQTPEDVANKTVSVISKGADSFVARYLSDPEHQQVKDTQKILDSYAKYGLRTLFVASGKTSLDNFHKYRTALKNARLRKGPEGKKAVEEIHNAIENGAYNPGGLQLLGATAIEDKLQDDVGVTLKAFRNAGIRTWVLTGDKVETAVEIGKACELITGDMTIVKMREKARDEWGQKIDTTPKEMVESLQWKLRTKMGDAFSLYYRDRKHKLDQDTEPNENASIMSARASETAKAVWEEWLPMGDKDKPSHVKICPSAEDRRRYEELAAESGGPTPVALVVEGGALMKLGMGQPPEFFGRVPSDNDPNVTKEQRKDLEIAHAIKRLEYFNYQEPFVKMAGSLSPPVYNNADGCTITPDVKVVLCCRVSPLQKGQVTTAVKTILGRTTLGVGDGANDVDMITEADLGVGIQGVEGSQAVNNADFALCQFKHLQNLLFVHGRWTYRRLGKAVCYFFYKNIIPTTTIFLYTLLTGFSGSPMYEALILSTYNLFFTSLPVIAFAFLEQDVDYDTSIENPPLYSAGQRNAYLNQGLFIRWCLEAFMSSCFLFVVPWYSTAANPNGKVYSFEASSIAMFTFILFAVTYRIAIETQHWTRINALFYIGSLVMWFLYIMTECGLKTGIVTRGVLYWEIFNLMGDAVFWLNLLLAPFTAVLPAIIYKVMKELYWPTDSLKVRHDWLEKVKDDEENEQRRKTLSQTIPEVHEDDTGDDGHHDDDDHETAIGAWFRNRLRNSSDPADGEDAM